MRLIEHLARRAPYLDLRTGEDRKSVLLIPPFFFDFGGEGGIRTLDTLPYTHFPGVRLRPLGHLSVARKFSTALSARG